MKALLIALGLVFSSHAMAGTLIDRQAEKLDFMADLITSIGTHERTYGNAYRDCVFYGMGQEDWGFVASVCERWFFSGWKRQRDFMAERATMADSDPVMAAYWAQTASDMLEQEFDGLPDTQ